MGVVKDWIVACVSVSVFAVILALFCTLKKRNLSRKGRYNCKFIYTCACSRILQSNANFKTGQSGYPGYQSFFYRVRRDASVSAARRH